MHATDRNHAVTTARKAALFEHSIKHTCMHMPGKLFAHTLQFLGKALCASGVQQDTQENGHTHTHSPQIMPSTRQAANCHLCSDL